MTLEELGTRLGALESARTADTQRSFMDKYGQKFNNNNAVGVAILNELNRRGVDTSAADEAVQQILDQVRQEAQQVLDMINNQQSQVSDLMNNVQAISESVSSATGLGGGMEAPAPAAEVPAPAPEAAPPTPGADAPPAADMGAAAPADATAEAPATEEAILPPAPEALQPDGGVAPAEEPVQKPSTIPSDARLKSLRNAVKPKAPAPVKAWKPSNAMLRAVMGGMG
jgi:hypothetical protein